MSLSEETLLELMAYADDELDGTGRARIEVLLAGDAEARGVVASLGIVGRIVERVEGERAQRAGADGIAADVMKALQRDAPDGSDASVISLASARRTTAWRWAGAGALVALAAGYALVARSPSRYGVTASVPETILAPLANVEANVESPTPVPSSSALPPLETAVAETEMDEPGQGVRIDLLDSPAKPVSVIYVPATATENLHASSVVVWISDDDGGH